MTRQQLRHRSANDSADMHSGRADPGTGPGLRRGVLGLAEMIGNSLANIGPTIEVVFVVGAIGATVGLGAPFLILIGMVAFLFHLNTTATFSKLRPHAGSYTSFMKITWGNGAGAFGAVLFLLGYYLGLLSAVGLLVGFWTQATLQNFFNVTVPWPILMVVFISFAVGLNARGLAISTRVAIALFIFESVVVLASLVVMAVDSSQNLTLAAFEPSSLQGGFGAIGIAFPLAIFMIIGASNSAPLAEEVERAHRNIPLAIYGAALLAMALFLFASVSLDAAFGNSAHLLAKAAIPIVVAKGVAGTFLVRVIYLAGFTSVIGILIAGVNSGSRVVFSLAREHYLPRYLAKCNRWQVPGRIFVVGPLCAMAIAGVTGGLLGASNGFAELSSAGTSLYVLLLIVVNFALIGYSERQRRSGGFSLSVGKIVTRYVVPLVGSVLLGYPLWESVKPGSAGPEGWTWLVSVCALFVGLGSWIVVARSKREVGVAPLHEWLTEETVGAG